MSFDPTIFKPGDIFFLKTKDRWISKAIAWFMNSQWSHCGIVIGNLPHDTVTLETSDFEVCRQSMRDYVYQPHRYKLKVVRIIGENQNLSEQEALRVDDELSGKIYGYLQFISLAIRGLLKRVGKKIPNFIRQGIICTGVVVYAKQKIEGPLFGVDAEDLDVEDLYQILDGKYEVLHDSG